MKRISRELAEALVSAHERTGPESEVDRYTTVGTEHVRYDEYQSYERLAVRDPAGFLFAFEVARNFGAGEGMAPEPSDQHSTRIALTPVVDHRTVGVEYRVDYDRK